MSENSNVCHYSNFTNKRLKIGTDTLEGILLKIFGGRPCNSVDGIALLSSQHLVKFWKKCTNEKSWHFSIITILFAVLFLAIRLLDKIYFGKYAPMWTAKSSLFITKDGKKEKVSKYFSWESKNSLRPHYRISSFI